MWFFGIVVADQSPIDLQPKNAVFDRTELHWLQLFFSRKAVADRLQYMCDRGFSYCKSMRNNIFYHTVRLILFIEIDINDSLNYI